MLFTVVSAVAFVEKRRLMEVFPQSVKEAWNDWELRILLLLSLALQILLVLLGNRRKYIPHTRIRITLWSAYLLADWVATLALGVIAKNIFQQDLIRHRPGGAAACTDDESINELMSFWAPFLLLHMGGPDTITAYALEDNALWLRHLVGLLIQAGVAVYIFLLSWPGTSWLPILSILILNAGLIKYGERTWALMSANTEYFRDSILTPPDSGPNYAKFMEEFTLKAAEGFLVKADAVIEVELPSPTDGPELDVKKDKLICKAYDHFQTFKRLFVDLILSFQDRDSSQKYFKNLESEKAFHVIEVELGFAFDVFYTKVPVAYTPLGCLLRLASFSSTLWGLVTFVMFSDTNLYHTVDLVITYLLLVVAVLLDVYAVFVALCSDWTHHWLIKHNRTQKLWFILYYLQDPDKKRWSNSMAQYNLLSVCFREKPAVCHRLQRLLGIDTFREKHRYKTYNKVSQELKRLIFNQFNEFTGNGGSRLKVLCTSRGRIALEDNKCHDLLWSTKEVEFDQSILIWHIATDLCYHSDDASNLDEVSSECRKISKYISDYMLYLLVMCPFMLPIGIGMIRFRDTCEEAREFFQERSPKDDKAQACRKLLRVNTAVLPSEVKGDRSKSVLFDGCRLARPLRSMKNGQKWKVVSHVWVDMLAYAATHCRGHHHAQQLRKGGELLTHVWLLMAHLGITEQCQISQGHARAKLIVK